MEVPIIPGRSTETEAIATLLNPANEFTEQMVTVPVGTPYLLAPLANRQQVIIQGQVPADGALWIKWNGVAAVGDGMRIPAGAIIGMKVAASCQVSIVAESAPVTTYIAQLGGKYT